MMRKHVKKVLAGLLSAAMVFGTFPSEAFAEVTIGYVEIPGEQGGEQAASTLVSVEGLLPASVDAEGNLTVLDGVYNMKVQAPAGAVALNAEGGVSIEASGAAPDVSALNGDLSGRLYYAPKDALVENICAAAVKAEVTGLALEAADESGAAVLAAYTDVQGEQQALDLSEGDLLLVVGETPAEQTEGAAPAETESETAAPAEGESEAELESELQGENVAPAETESEDAAPAESESETELESEIAAPVESESEAESELQSEDAVPAESESEAESELQNEDVAPAESESETEAESELQSEDAAPIESESETEFGSELQSEDAAPVESESGIEAGSESELQSEDAATAESESETEAESELQSEDAAPIESESETELGSELQSEDAAPVESESGIEAESELQNEDAAPAESEFETEVESESELQSEDAATAESESGIEAGSEIAAPAGTKTEIAAPVETESESETEVLTEAETESESETEAEIVTTTQDVEGTLIEVSYPADAFEEEVTLQATAITAGEQYEEVEDALNELQESDESFSYGTFVAFDISFLSMATGEEVEPLKEVSVSIKLNGDQQLEETENTNLVHIPEESGKAEVVENAQISADATEVRFQNDEFSTYVVTGGSEPIELGAVTVTAGAETLVGEYNTLYDALAAATEAMGTQNVTVTLNQDLTGAEQIGATGAIQLTIGTTKTLTIDMAEHTIDAKDGDGILTVLYDKKGKVIISNGIFTGSNRTIQGAALEAKYGKATDGQLELNHITFTGNTNTGSSKKGSSFYAYKKVQVTLNDCTFSDNDGNYGVGIFASANSSSSAMPEVILNNCTISSNTARNQAPAIYSDYAKVTVNGGSISDNVSKGSAGAIYASGGTMAIQNGTVISNNTAKSGAGGGIYTYYSVNLQLDGVTITGNSALGSSSGCGGGVSVGNGKSGRITAQNTTISGNTAAKDGGGLYLSNASTTGENKLTNCIITDNKATSGGGGGMYLSTSVGGTVIISGGEISRNTAKSGGGGLYNSSTLTIKDQCVVKENTSQANGGGAYITSSLSSGKFSNTKIENTTFEGNTAQNGGGLYSSALMDMKNMTVTGNHAIGTAKPQVTSDGTVKNTGNGGGGIYYSYGTKSSYLNPKGLTMTIDGGSITDNDAASGFGCGIAVAYGATPQADTGIVTIKNTVTVSGNITSAGGAEGSEIGFVLSPEDFNSITEKEPAKLIYLEKGESLTEKVESKTRVVGKAGAAKEETIDGKTYVVLYAAAVVYLDGINGDNQRDGITEETAVKTYAKAEALLKGMIEESNGKLQAGTIYIVGTAEVSVAEKWPSDSWDKSWEITLSRNDGFRGHLVSVSSSGDLTLGNGGKIVITGNNDKSDTTDGANETDTVSADYAAIKVDKGHLTIEEGAVLKNNTNKAHNTHDSEINYTYDGGAIYSNNGTITMTGGVITGNKASSFGGGIELWGGQMTFSGGTIENNMVGNNQKKGYGYGYDEERVPYGGGIAVFYGAKLTMSGTAKVDSNVSNTNGGGIAIGGHNTDTTNNASFTMTGGSISNNTAYNSGGGIYIQCRCSGEISEGNITGNKLPNTHTFVPTYGGGGIYVNGGKAGEPNGELHLTNVLVTDNTCYNSYDKTVGIAGGLAACYTANVKVYLTNGGAIYGNSGIFEVYMQKNHLDGGSSGGVGNIFVSNFMLGGGAYRWIDKDGNLIPYNEMQSVLQGYYYLNNNPSESARATAAGLASVRITGNSAYDGAAGIGTNGNVTIGDAPKTNFTVTKYWGDPEDSNYYDSILDNVNIWLLKEKDDRAEYVGYQELKWYKYWNIETDSTREWKKSVTFEDLPDDGSTYTALEEYILKDGTHIWSADKDWTKEQRATYEAVVAEITGGASVKWSDELDAYYRAKIEEPFGDKVNIVNIPTVTVAFQAKKSYKFGETPVDLQGGEFTFELTQVEKQEDGTWKAMTEDDGISLTYCVTAQNDKDGNVFFPAVRYEYDAQTAVNGVNKYYYRIEELPGSNQGITYDGTKYVVGVKVFFNETTGKLTAEKFSVAENGKEIPLAEEGFAASFENVYRAKGSLDLDAQKTLSGHALAADQFSFTLTAVDADGEALTGDAVYTDTVTNAADGKVEFKTIDYSEADAGKTYYYQVAETDTGAAGYTYDDSVYTVAVTVTDNGNGTMSTSQVITKDGAAADAITFANTYAAKGSLALEAQKTLAGHDLAAGQFSFTLTAVDADGEALTGDAAYTETVTNAADGKVEFEAFDYTEADDGNTYYYQIAETDAGAAGYTYDDSVYTVAVTVTDNSDGTLDLAQAVTKDGTAADAITFANTYAAEGSLALEAQKTLSGHDLAAGQFSFTLTAVDENGKALTGNAAYTDTVANAADGKVSFKALDYTEADDGNTYYYQIAETDAGAAGYTYDDSVYTVAVTVTDNGNGTMSTSQAITKDGAAADAITFANTYTAEGSLALEAQKMLAGHALAAGQFSFTLTAVDADGEALTGDAAYTETVTNAADGKVSFEAIGYTEADDGNTYYYQIAETDAGAAGYTYDDSVYTVAVTVTDNGDGTLDLAQAVTKDGVAADAIIFANTYAAKGSLALEAQKTLSGHDLAADQFSFMLTAVDADGKALTGDAAYTETAANAADGKVTFKALDYTEADAGKTYYYQVTEANAGEEGYTYDASVYTVAVTVTDNGDGTVGTSRVITKDGTAADAITFANTYTDTYAAKGSLAIEAQKTLAGHALAAGQFSFTLTAVDADGKALTGAAAYTDTAANAADGKVSFKAIGYTEADAGKTYYYQVAETNAGAAGYTYDSSVYTVAVAVTDNGDGTLGLARTITKDGAAADAITFANTYAAAGQAVVTARKTLAGGTLAAGQFSFTLTATDAAGNALTGAAAYTETVANAADGSVVFTPFRFTQADAGSELHYTVAEAAGTAADITYDTTAYAVTVTVADNGDGTLAVTQTIQNRATGAAVQEMAFTNTYTPAPAAAAVQVTKQLTYEGEPLNTASATFHVALYSDAACTQRVSDITPLVYENASSQTAQFTGLEAGRTYYVAETTAEGAVLQPGVEAEGQGFTPVFPQGSQVTVPEQGGVAVLAFENQYTTLPDGFYRQGDLYVTKQLLGADGAQLSADETFYAGFFADSDYTQPFTVVSNETEVTMVPLKLEGSSTTTVQVGVPFPADDSPVRLYVTEVDPQGNPVEGSSSFAYDVTVEGFEVTMDTEHPEAVVTITNTEQEGETETEPETEKETEYIEEESGTPDAGAPDVVPADTTSVKTGDETPLALYIGLLAAAAALIALLLVFRRRKRG